MIKRLLLSLILIGIAAPQAISDGDDDKVLIYHKTRRVCSGRLNKCFPLAMGSAQYPTPTWSGARFLTKHYKTGFTWRNPLNKRIYKPNQHNLGPIWIQVINNDKGWNIGIHQTPELNKPIHKQYSHGCLRMLPNDIREFSNSVKYLDKFYSIK